MRPGTPEEPPSPGVLTFDRNRPPQLRPPDAVWSQWARHVIICVEDAFPVGTVRRLEAADPKDCFGVIDTALDVGQGSRYLRDLSIWSNLESEFMPPGAHDYAVITFHIAPTHAHVLIREAEGFSLDATVERWKAMTIRSLGHRRATDREIWAPGYYDTVLNEPHEIEAARIAIDFHQRLQSSGE